MAKLTKKQEVQYKSLIELHHKLIKAKMSNKRSDYEEVINQIREEVNEDDEK